MEGMVNEIKMKPEANEVMSLENLIKNHVKSISELKAELKKVREMYNDSFINNPTYREHEQAAKDATKIKTQTKAQIAKEPAVASLAQKVKDIRFDLKETQRTLSDLLLDYKEQTGATQLELFSGETMAIVQSAKLAKAK